MQMGLMVLDSILVLLFGHAKQIKLKIKNPSFLRRQKSHNKKGKIPAFAGMTKR